MQIVATFNDYEEMENFAKKVLSQSTETVPEIEIPVDKKLEVVKEETAKKTTKKAKKEEKPKEEPILEEKKEELPFEAEATRVYTLEELGAAGADIMDSKPNELFQLLDKLGISTLSELDPSRYAEFADGLRAIGGKI